MVLTKATVDIPAAAVGSVVGVGWGVGASCGVSVAAGEVGEPVGDGIGVPVDVGERSGGWVALSTAVGVGKAHRQACSQEATTAVPAAAEKRRQNSRRFMARS